MTGPTVNRFDLSQFKDKFTFICNHFYRHDDVQVMNPTFYSHLENANRTMKQPDESEKSITLVRGIVEKCPNTTLILHHTARKYLKGTGLIKKRRVYYVSTRNEKLLVDAKIDFTKRSIFTKGSVYFLLSMAIYMGFKKIYLIGAGYTLEPYQWFHFYEPYDSPEYKNIALELKSQKPEIEHKIMKKVSERYDCQIINVVPEGFKSPIYDSVSVDDLLTKLSRDN